MGHCAIRAEDLDACPGCRVMILYAVRTAAISIFALMWLGDDDARHPLELSKLLAAS